MHLSDLPKPSDNDELSLVDGVHHLSAQPAEDREARQGYEHRGDASGPHPVEETGSALGVADHRLGPDYGRTFNRSTFNRWHPRGW